jgi:peptidoglycan hydrolase-like protein with peptidoglycan-binding domain
MKLFPAIGLAAALIALPQADAVAARARDKLPTQATDPLQLPTYNATVERVQRALAQAHYYTGPINGRFSKETETAIRNYQRREGLPQNPVASEELAVHIETSAKVQSLLKQLQRQRLSKMDEARKALLASPETRNLIGDPENSDTKATVGRDAAPCFASPTPKCLLDEASMSAIAIFKTELRDWVLGEILVAKAKAGLVAEAMQTVRLIDDPRLILVALRDIAKALAAAGRPVEALSAADIIPDMEKRLEALAAIASVQINREDFDGAADTAQSLLDALDQISSPLKRISLAARAAIILAKSGEKEPAEKELAKIKVTIQSGIEDRQRSIALRHLASALAETGKPEQALDILKDLPDDSERTPVLVSAATAQAQAGNARQAISTAESIEPVRYRAIVLSSIAVAQVKAGKATAGRETLDKALQAASGIKRPFARAYAYERISLALMEIARLDDPQTFQQAIDTAGLISDNKLRAHSLWSLGTGQLLAGDEKGAAKTNEMAEHATKEIKSPFTRVWMFTEIALEHFSMQRKSAAWTAFTRALTIAEGIESAWGRSRALARLASSLIELGETMKK